MLPQVKSEDTFNNRIRKVTANGVINTIVGTGQANFSGDGGPAKSAALDDPAHVAVDSAGNVLIVDGQRIRRVGLSGIINTVAGNGCESVVYAGCFSGDGGPAINAALNDPNSSGVDGAGNIVIADTGNFRIRQVNSIGVINTIAGNGTYRFSGDGGPASSASGIS